MCMLTIDFDYVKAALPPRDPAGHKGDFGKVYVLGGSVGYTGAPVARAIAEQFFFGAPEAEDISVPGQLLP